MELLFFILMLIPLGLTVLCVYYGFRFFQSGFTNLDSGPNGTAEHNAVYKILIGIALFVIAILINPITISVVTI